MYSYQKGFTLLELVILLSMLALFLTAALVLFPKEATHYQIIDQANHSKDNSSFGDKTKKTSLMTNEKSKDSWNY